MFKISLTFIYFNLRKCYMTKAIGIQDHLSLYTIYLEFDFKYYEYSLITSFSYLNIKHDEMNQRAVLKDLQIFELMLFLLRVYNFHISNKKTMLKAQNHLR